VQALHLFAEGISQRTAARERAWETGSGRTQM